ncbi:hypothetical protein J8TS2_28090 [Lederbergia ruris]|uniref:Uncharacterized protein n=1 Tax=Lederbergia ruris TaxID=217495 RepID=A0ABQ4KKL5_9BACI|nr:hypothetical protein [Lederbergia ruris]GIN58490.1 hypothetical protein J8TS2_28090 [Lederbergia ruris]
MISYQIDQFGVVHNIEQIKGEDKMSECKCCRELERRMDQLEFDVRLKEIERMQDEIGQGLDAVIEKLDELNG